MAYLSLTRRFAALILGLAAPAVLLAGAAKASDDAAWAEFRSKVEEACRAQLGEVEGEAQILVNPFGSESYGAAVVSVASTSGTDRMICIFDKASGIAELTAPFAAGSGN